MDIPKIICDWCKENMATVEPTPGYVYRCITANNMHVPMCSDITDNIEFCLIDEPPPNHAGFLSKGAGLSASVHYNGDMAYVTLFAASPPSERSSWNFTGKIAGPHAMDIRDPNSFNQLRTFIEDSLKVLETLTDVPGLLWNKLQCPPTNLSSKS